MRPRTAILTVVAVGLSAAAMYSLQLRLDAYKGDAPYVGEFMRLPEAGQLKSASLGYDMLVADMLWLKAVQHMGEREISSQGYDWIYKALDTVTSLDPQFIAPYEVGGLILTLSAEKAELSNRLLLKGYRHNPEVWQFPFYIGFNYFYFLKNYKAAARFISIAAEIDGSPGYLPLLASRLYYQARDPAYALEFLARMYESMEDERLRAGLAKRMDLLEAEVEARALQQAVDHYTSMTGSRPAGLSELVRAGLLKSVPEEPNGGYYYIDEDGVVKSSKVEEHLGVYTH